MTPPQRAVMAAEILDGALIVQNLTAKSIAMIVNANMAYVCAALRSTPEQRELVKRGQRPLIPTRARAAGTGGDRLAQRRRCRANRDRPVDRHRENALRLGPGRAHHSVASIRGAVANGGAAFVCECIWKGSTL
jgi:hypothetical protein